MKPRLLSSVRVVFGLIWIIDGLLGLQPGVVPILFEANEYSGIQGQPEFLRGWLYFWYTLIVSHPVLAMDAVTVLSFIIGVGFIAGVFLKPLCLIGGLFSGLIWAVTGFGGPYQPYTPDVGAPIIYVLVFAVLLGSGESSVFWSLDNVIRLWRSKARSNPSGLRLQEARMNLDRVYPAAPLSKRRLIRESDHDATSE